MPLRQVVKSHRHFAGDTLHSHIGTQPPQHLDHQREILLGGTQAEAAGLGVVLRGKGRSPNELLSNIKFVNEYLTCLFRSVFKKFFHDFVEAALSCIVQGGVLEVV